MERAPGLVHSDAIYDRLALWRPGTYHRPSTRPLGRRPTLCTTHPYPCEQRQCMRTGPALGLGWVAQELAQGLAEELAMRAPEAACAV